MTRSRVQQEQLEVLAGRRRTTVKGQSAVRLDDFNKTVKTLATTASLDDAKKALNASVEDVSAALTAAQEAVTDSLEALALGKSNVLRTINTYSALSVTLGLDDIGAIVRMTGAATKTLIVPPSSAVTWPIGAQIDLRCAGTGKLTLSPGSGVSIEAFGSKLSLEPMRFATLIYWGGDVWAVDGAMVA